MEQEKLAGRHFSKNLITIIVLILIAFGAFVYLYNAHKSPSKGSPVAKVQKPDTPITSRPISAGADATLNIPDLGVKLNIPLDLSGLAYTVTKAPSVKGHLVTVQFIMKSYSSLANKCAGVDDKVAHPFANLSKSSGRLVGNDQGSVMKQFNDYSIVNSGSSLPPAIRCKDKATQEQLLLMGANLTKSLQRAFQSAERI